MSGLPYTTFRDAILSHWLEQIRAHQKASKRGEPTYSLAAS